MKEYDILRDYEIINAWKDEASFPVQKASSLEMDQLNNLTVFELSFEGTGGDNTIFDIQYSKFASFSREMILLSVLPIYIYQSDFKPQLVSRLRTYKGIFSKKILKEKEYCEVEIPFSNKMSLIGGLAKVNTTILDSYINIGIDSANSFIIAIDDPEFFTKNTVVSIVQELTSHYGMSEINYLKLILRYCLQGAIIYRFSGDGGDRYFSLQIFCNKANRQLILQQYERVKSSG